MKQCQKCRDERLKEPPAIIEAKIVPNYTIVEEAERPQLLHTPFSMPTFAAVIAALLLLFLCAGLMRVARWRQRRLPPGPRGWPLLGGLLLIGPIAHAALAEMANRFGPVMYLKLGTTGTIVLSSPHAARAFFKTHDLLFANRPPLVAARIKAELGPDLVFSDHGLRRKLLRRLCTLHMLGGSALAAWAGIRSVEVGRLICSLHRCGQRGEPALLMEMLVRTVANVIGLVSLSRRVFDTDDGEAEEFKRTLAELMEATGALNVSDAVPLLAPLDVQGIERRLRVLQERLRTILTRMFCEHAASAQLRAGKPDLVDSIAMARDGEEGGMPSYSSIQSVFYDLLIAGTDTTSLAIEWAMAELLKNQDILKRLQSEADEVVGMQRRLQESDIPNLPYLQAVCKESLRLHPPTPLGIPHFSLAPCEVSGYFIPARTRVIVNIWAIGRDPAVWESPLEFRPERFLGGRGAEMEPYGADLELMPFGAGRRACVGARMAVLIMQYVLGTLVHAFEWELPAGAEISMDEAPGLALTKAVPVSALVRARLAPTAYEVNDQLAANIISRTQPHRK